MPIPSSIWGPDFKEYFNLGRFEPKASRVSDYEAQSFYDAHGVLPLASMEALLRLSDPRFDEAGQTHSSLVDIMMMIQNYQKVIERPIFGRYYGYICIRHLLHSICLAIVRETGSMALFLPKLKKAQSWGEMSCLLAEVTSAYLSGAVWVGKPVPERLKSVFNSNVCTINPTRESTNLSMLTHILWDDRDSLLTLCRYNMLPGCSVLLMIMGFHMPPATNAPETVAQDLLYFRDLSARLYLASTTNWDRHIAHYLSYMIPERGLKWPAQVPRYKDATDSHAVVQAFSRLFDMCNASRLNYIIPVSAMADLTEFVQKLIIETPSVTLLDDTLTVARISFGFLWLSFELPGRLTPDVHETVYNYGCICLMFLENIQWKCAKTRSQEIDFAEAFGHLDIIAAFGRILLLWIDKAQEGSNGPAHLSMALDMFERIVNKAIKVAPHHFAEPSIEYAKVDNYLSMRVASKLDTHRAHSASLEMLKGWSRWEQALGDHRSRTVRRCAYPRCFQGCTNEKVIKMYYVCERCRVAVYCSLDCRTRHWKLRTSGSHQLACGSGTR